MSGSELGTGNSVGNPIPGGRVSFEFKGVSKNPNSIKEKPILQHPIVTILQ